MKIIPETRRVHLNLISTFLFVLICPIFVDTYIRSSTYGLSVFPLSRDYSN
jgi:hypothetical protein